MIAKNVIFVIDNLSDSKISDKIVSLKDQLLSDSLDIEFCFITDKNLSSQIDYLQTKIYKQTTENITALDSKYLIKNYVILTNNPDNYNKLFISNNVLSFDKDEKTLYHEIKWIFTTHGKNKVMDARHTWFISDTHFYHTNVIKYCNRPYANTEEMNEQLIKNWNSLVGKDDIVWHLGDFSFGSKNYVKDLVARLNGRINLVTGNHDKQSVKFYLDAGFNKVYDKPVIFNTNLILSHEPIMFVDNTPFINLYGHVHDCESFKTITANSACLCVERWDYKPVNWKTISRALEEFKNQEQINGDTN